MLDKEIELVDSVMSDGGVWSHKREAWYKIKDALNELQNTSSNSDYTKCCESPSGEHSYQDQPVCVHCGHFA